VLVFSLCHEKGHYRKGFERKICDNNMMPGYLPQAQTQAQRCACTATEETRKGWRRCVSSECKATSRYHSTQAAWSHEKPPPCRALCAPLGCLALVPRGPKSSGARAWLCLHTCAAPSTDDTNTATAFKVFSEKLKSSLYIPLQPPQKELYPTEFTLKQKSSLCPRDGKKEQTLSSVHVS